MNKRILFPVLAGLLILALITLSGKEEPPPSSAAPALSVTVIRPWRGSIAPAIAATGMPVHGAAGSARLGLADGP